MKEKIYLKNTIMVTRALLAACFMSTLLCTPFDDLYPVKHISFLKDNISGLANLNYYLWFDNLLIPHLISLFMLGVVISGYFPRYICVVQVWVSYSINYTMLVTEGGDQINCIINLLLIPICVLDHRINAWRNIDAFKNNLPWFLHYNAKVALFFIKLQIAILYLNAGMAKIYSPGWSNGTAVYYWFNDPTFGAPKWINNNLGYFFTHDLSVTIINWGVIVLELGLFLSLFMNKSQQYLLFIVGVAFHFAIFLVHGLPSFGLSMMACLILLLFNLDFSFQNNVKQLTIQIKKLFTNAQMQHTISRSS